MTTNNVRLSRCPDCAIQLNQEGFCPRCGLSPEPFEEEAPDA
jgi:rubredoxin